MILFPLSRNCGRQLTQSTGETVRLPADDQRPLEETNGAEPMKASNRNLPKKAAAVAFSLFLPLLAIESYCRFMFLHPQLLPTGLLLFLLRGIYLNNREFIQYNARCARYDARLTYTLRPGRCTFSNVEFMTVVEANRAGLRDD